LRKRFATLGLGLVFGIASCKHVDTASASKSDASGPSFETLFDLNDVSILFPYKVKREEMGDFVTLSSKTSEGPIVSEESFNSVKALLKSAKFKSYGTFAVAGVRIDDCAKILPNDPCQAQLRLVFQALLGDDRSEEGNDLRFDDFTLHVAFNLDANEKMKMFQDFLDLKKSAVPISTVGPLGPHPVLAKQGMKGAFAKKLKNIILKYGLPSRYDRIAIMGLGGTPGSPLGFPPPQTIWEFAATLPIKNGKIAATPIPCQNPDQRTNTFEINDLFGMRNGKVREPMVGCDDRKFDSMVGNAVTPTDPVEIQAAIKTTNPDLVFFGTTTCTNCHVASRRLDGSGGVALSVADDGNPIRFKRPSGVSQTVDPRSREDNNNTWGFRAFGWGQHSNEGRPGITTYTLHETMRVAHALNELVKKEKLK